MNTIASALPLAGTILLGALAAAEPGNGYGQSPAGRGQINVQAAPGWGWPYGAASMPYWGYWYSPCYPFASCSAYQQFQMLERRRDRFDELARGQQLPPQTRNGLPLPRRNGEAKRSNDPDVRPAYVGSGQLRDQYQETGDFLPEFLDGRVRPSR